MNKKCVFLFAALSCQNLYAEGISNTLEKTVESYANAIGCNYQFKSSSVVPMDIDNDDLSEYIVLFYIDAGCAGGSNTASPVVAVVKARDEFHEEELLIVPEKSLPYNSVGEPPVIEKLYIKNGQLWYSGKTHSETDLNNFPSVTVKGPLKLIESKLKTSKNSELTSYHWSFQ